MILLAIVHFTDGPATRCVVHVLMWLIKEQNILLSSSLHHLYRSFAKMADICILTGTLKALL